MNTPEQNHLLNDILAQDSYADFRAKLQRDLHRQIRRRRWQRRAPYLALAATLAFLGVILLRPTPTPAPLEVVRTEALEPAQAVRTTEQLLVRVHSSAPPQIVRTATDARPVRRLTDDELLALFPDSPVALVSLSGGGKHLLFLNQEDPTSPPN